MDISAQDMPQRNVLDPETAQYVSQIRSGPGVSWYGKAADGPAGRAPLAV
jgi:hypothetical protein